MLELSAPIDSPAMPDLPPSDRGHAQPVGPLQPQAHPTDGRAPQEDPPSPPSKHSSSTATTAYHSAQSQQPQQHVIASGMAATSASSGPVPLSSPSSEGGGAGGSTDEAPLTLSSSSSSDDAPSPPQQSLPHHPAPSTSSTRHLDTILAAAAPRRPGLARAGTDPYHGRLPPPQPSAQVSGLRTNRGAASAAQNPALISLSNAIAASSSAASAPSAPSASASTSSTRARRLMRYANPDEHWLSEDEGEMLAQDVARNRRAARDRYGHSDGRFRHPRGDRGDGDDDDDTSGLHSGKDSDRDKAHALTLAQSAMDPDGHRPHPIDHKPAKALQQPMPESDPLYAQSKLYTSSIPDLASVTPNLLKALQCPACDKLMQDPTTLVCGHSLCLGCSAPEISKAHIQRVALSSAAASTLAYSAGMEADHDAVGDPSALPVLVGANQEADKEGGREAQADEHHLHRELHDNTRAHSPEATSATIAPPSPTGGSPKAIIADTFCPVAECRKLTKAKAYGRNGSRPDFVLQKLTSIVRAHVPLAQDASSLKLDSDAEDGEEGSEGDEQHHNTQHLYDVHHYTTPAQIYANLESSPRPSPHSSPEESPFGEEGSKRMMGTSKRQYSSGKRPRSAGRNEGTTSSSSNHKLPAILPTLISDVLSELECQVCVTLIYEPITTPCGHTFCKRCLFRSLDHSSRCPLCRTELPGFSFFITAAMNHTLSNLILTTFPVLYEERKDAADKEQEATGLDTPIFVCMVSFPQMPTNLHIYEPRYRLMMRRAMDTNKRFGMVLPSRANGGFSQYGTMLEIRSLQMFDDGRSLVKTVGVHRFKILESGTVDGYTVGRIERIEDISDEEEAELERLALARGAEQARARQAANGPSVNEANAAAAGRQEPQQQQQQQQATGTSVPAPSSQAIAATMSSSSATSVPNSMAPALSRFPSSQQRPATPAPNGAAEYPEAATDNSELTNKELIEVCKGFVEALRTGSTPWLLQRLNDSVPPEPDDPREFTWWMAMLMPIDEHEKARLLQITSYRLRLRLLVFWIQQMQHSWWFSRGCVIA